MGFRSGKGKVAGFRSGFLMSYGVSVGVDDGDFVILSVFQIWIFCGVGFCIHNIKTNITNTFNIYKQ
jgi:hypothetical protein